MGARTKLTWRITLLMLFGVFDCCMIGGGKSLVSIPNRLKPLLLFGAFRLPPPFSPCDAVIGFATWCSSPHWWLFRRACSFDWLLRWDFFDFAIEMPCFLATRANLRLISSSSSFCWYWSSRGDGDEDYSTAA